MSVTRDALQEQLDTTSPGVFQIQACYQTGLGNMALAYAHESYVLLFFDNYGNPPTKISMGMQQNDAITCIKQVAHIVGAQALDLP